MEGKRGKGAAASIALASVNDGQGPSKAPAAPFPLTTPPNYPTRNSRRALPPVLCPSMPYRDPTRDKTAWLRGTMSLPALFRAHQPPKRFSGWHKNAFRPRAISYLSGTSPNSRTSTCLPGPYNGPTREQGADYRGPFTETINVAHTTGIPVRQFGEMSD